MIDTPPARALLARLRAETHISLPAVDPAAQPFLVAVLRLLAPERPLLVVTSGLKVQESFFQDLLTWLQRPVPTGIASDGPSGAAPPPKSAPAATICPVQFFPAWEVLPHESKLPHADVVSERLETLMALRRLPASLGESAIAPVVVTQAAAVLQKTWNPQAMLDRSRLLVLGQSLNPLDLVEWLEDQGYEPEAQVNHKGELSLRGGILDVFPLTSPWPIRLEFFGNELESLRQFDPVTQMSRASIESIELGPAGEIGLLKRQIQASSDNPSTLPLPTSSSLLAHFPPNTLAILCEPDDLIAHVADFAGRATPGDPLLCDWGELWLEAAERRITRVDVSGLGDLGSGFQFHDGSLEARDRAATLDLASLEAFRPVVPASTELQVAEAQRREFFGQLHRWMRQGYAVHVFCNTDGERQRFQEIWTDFQVAVETTEATERLAPALQVGSLARGFLSHDSRLVVVTDAEIFGRYKVQRPRRLKSPHAVAARSALDIDFTDLQEGDYVVHVQYGIGRFIGLKRLEAAPEKGKGRVDPSSPLAAGEECLVIEYAASTDSVAAPRLYVPVSEAHLVSKYVGTGRSRPPLNALSGTRWAKAKAQAEAAVRDLAAELLSIQAARETQPGHAFPPDNPWQREFEGAFVYEETPDQWKAIQDTKRDMEAARPMDRLICGDVGYGKTEVAIRAAFKVVMGGKQVAILVPTTVLAQQHFNGFRERMADFPVRIELLSRFRKPREIRRVIEALATGAVDIVIGTHRLIQKDIAFKDLGLVVIDEEQRFGVMHKERFKLLRTLLDVLTLSATPIPRTLHLALTGARDMSTIETPPQDRLPVETVVCPYDERIVRDAIQRELNREGQVFYLHNRVLDIESVALKLKSLLPEARIVVGHGQMDPDDLERVMTQFVNGEADVLLSTTIIESGIDIPNANTIIIDRADRFGLSDLYQLRGRVGRYKHQAYAYLMIPRHAGLLSDARKRISAIKQYSSLGSGFKIAMRDLEIRGAGNLLGPQQSGHITAVGFELYCQLLKQSVSALKGQKVARRIETQVHLDFLAMSPSEDQATPKRGPKGKRGAKKEALEIHIPRELDFYYYEESDADRAAEKEPDPIPRASAYIPVSYIVDSRLRIEMYRKLAQTTDAEGLEKLRAEVRDRFGPLPDALSRLMQVQLLKIIAGEKGISSIETKGEKLMLMRRGDYVMVGGLFPRVTAKKADGRLKQVRELVEKS
ncbi:MAG: transcription-repair coupling factor [Verrucomicrobia bacterium]|nr:transcription-repair coupling factor [Verrucomicrobiota bacterium]MBI3868297.1 transcription-repair coupling factor [Verrucomicrobiota bacterium]